MTEKDNKDLNRTPRSADTRANKVARKPWSPPSTLDTPPAPEGYTYRWIRAEIVGQEDRKNVTSRLSEGFDLVRSDELHTSDQDRFDTLQQGRHAGVVA